MSARAWGLPVRIVASFIATPLLVIASASLSPVRQSPLAAHPAYAAACYDTGCDWQDPQTTGCSSDPTIVDAMDGYPFDGAAYGYIVQLRWSQPCGANWGRTWADLCPSDGCRSGVHFESFKDPITQDIDIGVFVDPAGSTPTRWTVMYSGASSSDRVCYEENWNRCTAWH